MGYNERTVGGGPARGLAKDFTGFLQDFITTGSFGGGTAGQQAGVANPMSDAANVFGLLNSIINNPQADQAVQDQISKTQDRNVNQIRARFGTSGGSAFGSPAAFAENQYRAEATPQVAMAMDQMAQNRLASLMPFFTQAMGISGMGIPQTQTTMQPNGWMQGLNLATQLGGIGANFLMPGSGALIGAAGNALTNMTPPTPGVTPIGMPTTPAVRNPATSILRPPQPYNFQQLYQ